MVTALLSCSSITSPGNAVPRHGARHVLPKVPPAATHPVVSPPAAPSGSAQQGSGSADEGVSGDVLFKGLPESWRAVVLDKPTPPPQPAQNGGKSFGAAAGKAGGAASGETATVTNRVLIPVPPDMGIAAFQSANRFLIVVDNARPMDTSALRGNGIFSTLTVSTLAAATLIQVQLPDTRKLYLSQQAEGWVLGDQPPPVTDYDDRRVISPRPGDGGILYPMRRPGRVLSITDPASGSRLFVGTSTMDDGGILSLRIGKGYEVWPTTEGVVVAVQSPEISMRATPDGPLLSVDGKAFPDEGVAVYASDVDLKWLGLQDLPPEKLRERLHDAFLAAADSDPAQRFEKRLEEAKAAFSAGSGTEARGILTVALEDDPEEANRPGVLFLLAASELVAGNKDGASLLEGPWPDSQKRAVQLWRGLYLAAEGGHEAEAAHLLAMDVDRLKNYPAPLRDMLLPGVAEEIARYGTQDDVESLENLPSGSAYQLVDAFRKLRSGQREQAYALFSKLSEDRDPIVAEKALEERLVMNIASGKTAPDAAAEQYNTLMPDARLAGREVQVRLQQADAYMRAHAWTDALDAIDTVQAGTGDAGDKQIPPILMQALAGIAQESSKTADKGALLHNAALIKAHLPGLPDGPRKGEVMVAYGKMLLRLGLPDEAADIFSSAVPMLATPDMKALAGEGLADANLERKRPQDALKALSVTDSPNLPDASRAARQRILARIALATGDQNKALALLSGDASPVSLDISARIHEGRGEWPAAVQDMHQLAASEIPAKGPLDADMQALALRLASDASQAGDRPMLDWVAALAGDRMDGDNARLFQLLTKPVDTTLPTAGPEAGQ
ncbi:tetratricopeptide repeat protein [Acetobacter sp.]|uniref:tetratricopeptide repeat protein n=1 Tax=Acetobacter sp. TaxID=440 RepID=UPI003D08C541